MMLPNNFDTTPFVLNNLKTKQKAFVQFLYESGHNTSGDIVFKRNYLKTIANAFGSEWAPAWIVKDVSRVTNRGMYAVPELDELIDEMNVVNGNAVSPQDAVAAHSDVLDVSPGHGNDGDDLSDSYGVADDMDDTMEVSDDMMATTEVL